MILPSLLMQPHKFVHLRNNIILMITIKSLFSYYSHALFDHVSMLLVKERFIRFKSYRIVHSFRSEELLWVPIKDMFSIIIRIVFSYVKG